jgi:tRNA-specific 2-thiouridylase
MSEIVYPDVPRDLAGIKVLVAMSGGVDSSVAALLLKARGADVTGVFMRSGIDHDSEDGEHFGCCSVSDAYDARRISQMLDMPYYVLNFESQFGRIMEYFVDAYQQGRTPNPCIACNQWLKFGHLYAYADTIEAQYVATGHYARTRIEDGRALLLRGLDPSKDQSYVLFSLSQPQMQRALFPCGGYEKEQIRQMARDAGFNVHDKPDSQEICFVPSNDYREFLEERRPGSMVEGPIVTRSGERVGTHPGYQQFTIGQRRGLGLAMGNPVYVVDIQPETNTVVIGEDEDLFGSELIAEKVNWMRPPTGGEIAAGIQIRYNGLPSPGRVIPLEGDRVRVVFDEPVRAITPGQAAVWYDGDVVLGGGWIL